MAGPAATDTETRPVPPAAFGPVPDADTASGTQSLTRFLAEILRAAVTADVHMGERGCGGYSGQLWRTVRRQDDKTVTASSPIVALSHVVQFYNCDDDLTEAVGDYTASAISDGGVALVIATPTHCQAFGARLTDLGIDIAAARLNRALISVDAGSALQRFVTEGQVDPSGFDSEIAQVIMGAAAASRPVFVYGEMVALLWDAGQINAALELETLWNTLGRKIPFSLYCAYPEQFLAGDTDGGLLMEICRLHTSTIEAREGGARRRALATDRAEVTCTFQRSLEATRAARRFAIKTMNLWRNEDLAGDAALVATELAANAVVHAQSDFTMSITAFGDYIRISVGDTSPVPNVSPGPALPIAPNHGLGVVSAVAAKWGVQRVAAGKAVWAELRVH